MKKIINGFLTYRTESWVQEKDRIDFTTYDPRKSKCLTDVVIREHSFEVDVPDNFDPRPEQIKALEKKQQEAAAAFHALTVEIKRQISELQSLENSTVVVCDGPVPF